jgi:hypothetical protein
MSILSYIESFYKEHSAESHTAALQKIHADGVAVGRASLMDDLRALFAEGVTSAEAAARFVKIGFTEAEAGILVHGTDAPPVAPVDEIPLNPATPGFVEVPVLPPVAEPVSQEPALADAAPSSSEPT